MSSTETDISMLLSDFSSVYAQENGEKPDWIPNAEDEISGVYDDTIEKHILPLLPNNGVDRHKRASVFEMCIMRVLPIQHSDENTRLGINAEFAFAIAKAIITNYWWPVIIEEQMHRLESFEETHLQWLKHAETEFYPFISNAIGWYLFEQIVTERYAHARGHSLKCNPDFK